MIIGSLLLLILALSFPFLIYLKIRKLYIICKIRQMSDHQLNAEINRIFADTEHASSIKDILLAELLMKEYLKRKSN